ncbi:MAG: type II secretion system protein, partial [Planctomycetota bacterium]|nr:type II secretion system protein [Planctomycetota bacterium]
MPASTRSRQAFTLLELLIVISIIAILLGILFPVLGQVRKAARGTATAALIRDVRTAVESFRTERGRLPGQFSMSQMGDMANNDRGFTMAENMLLELAGGVVTGEAADPGNMNLLRDVGPLSSNTVDVDPLAIGAADGPGYLRLKSENLRPIEGQATTIDEYDGVELNPQKAMPDIIDAFGQPLMIWRIDRAVPQTINQVDQFARLNSNTDRAAFYWVSNAGYIRSGDDMAP